MLSRQEEERERRETLLNDLKVREQEESRRVFADQSLPSRASTFHQHAQADADTPRGRFTAHERSTVIGSTALPVYPAGPAWCADPGAQCLEPPLGLDNPALEPSAVMHSPAEQTGDLTSGDVPSSALDHSPLGHDVERDVRSPLPAFRRR
jgi:hypothetical protein